MDDRLADFANSQLAAITDILDMVARDRRRVQALLREAESPSLRQYLQEWLHATATGLQEGENTTSTADYGRCIRDGDAEGASNSSNGCPCGCWDDPNGCPCGCWDDPSVSFWDILRYRPHCVHRRYLAAIQKHALQRSRLAYGVCYEWLTEPITHGSEGFDWEDVDHFFRGRDISFIETLDRDPEAAYVFIQQANIVSDSSWYRIVQIPDTEETQRVLFRGAKSSLPTVEDILLSKNQRIEYDIVFYAGEFNTLLRHQQTTQGNLILSATTQEIDITDNDANNIASTERLVLQGEIHLGCSMPPWDGIPAGGTFSFREATRFERIISEQAEADEWEHSSTSVISLYADAPVGLNNILETLNLDPAREAEDDDTPYYMGEMRLVGEYTPARLLSPKDVMAQSDPMIESAGFTDPDSVISLEEAEQKEKDYDNKKCLWMHYHTSLPTDVIQRIGEYVSPPPIFYLDAGDIVIDFDWSSSRQGEHGDQDDFSFISASCMVARRRVPH